MQQELQQHMLTLQHLTLFSFHALLRYEYTPVETICSIARLDALNSTGNVTTWKRTAAAIAIIPNKINPEAPIKIPAKIKKKEAFDPKLATGTSAWRKRRNA